MFFSRLVLLNLMLLIAWSFNVHAVENCPPDKHWNSEKKDCRSCPPGTTWNAKRLRCFCPTGQFTDNKNQRCVSCPANWTWDKTQQACTCGPRSLKDFLSGKMCIASRHVCSHNAHWDAANQYCVVKEAKKPKETAPAPAPPPTPVQQKTPEASDITGYTENFRSADFNIPLNVPEDKKRTAREKAEHEMESSLLRADIKKTDFIDLKDYNYILGVAATSDLIDQTKDSFREDLKKNQSSPDLNTQYDSLRGKNLEAVNCYGNGSSVCLAALVNGDLKAKKVNLYGPQITVSSLKDWESQISSSGVNSVTIYMLTHDPIPGASFVGDDNWSDFSSVFTQNKLMDLISEKAPSIQVMVSNCPIKNIKEKYDLDCNDPKQYQSVW
jgi:hypothetical protein